jgi:hypothetical protein
MTFSDLLSPAEASGRLEDLCKGFAQAGNRCPLGANAALRVRIMRAFMHLLGKSAPLWCFWREGRPQFAPKRLA